ncbi:MAG: hypothetical protein GF334_10355 [Candidatus Altiarchaeales archaeon]|nr:hypothetical protein [Candidatus Altiarchaeales archaeon]
MESIKNVFIAVDRNGVYLGTFETQELARLYGKDFANGEVSVISPVRNYPDQDQVLLGTFQVVEPTVQETPEPTPEPEPVETTSSLPPIRIIEVPLEEINGETPQEPVEEPATETAPEPEAPKPRTKRTRLSPERIQECCELVVGMMEAGNPYKRKQFLDLGIKPNEWTKTIRILLDQGKLRQEGLKRGACYFLVEGESGSNGSEGEATEGAGEGNETFPAEPSMAQIAAETVLEEPEATVED